VSSKVEGREVSIVVVIELLIEILKKIEFLQKSFQGNQRCSRAQTSNTFTLSLPFFILQHQPTRHRDSFSTHLTFSRFSTEVCGIEGFSDYISFNYLTCANPFAIRTFFAVESDKQVASVTSLDCNSTKKREKPFPPR
jgi:hypothetical protein